MNIEIIGNVDYKDIKYLNFKTFTFNDIEYDESWKFLFENKEIIEELNIIEKKLNYCDHRKILPKHDDIFNCFKLTKFPPNVIICGQDPYINENEGMGLAFSVNKNVKIPPSLKNIYLEIKNCYPDSQIPNHGDLSDWAKNGILLLNSALTVEKGLSSSHMEYWKNFSDIVIRLISEKQSGIVYMLWGKHSQEKKKLIDNTKNLILESSHPSPLSVSKGFNGCNHFKLCNSYLNTNGKLEIKWL